MQGKYEGWYLPQSSLPRGAQLSWICITTGLLRPASPDSSSLPQKLRIPNKYLPRQALPQCLLPLNPTNNECLLCFLGRHPNEEHSAHLRRCTIHTTTNFPSALRNGVFPEEHDSLRGYLVENYRHCSHQIKKSAHRADWKERPLVAGIAGKDPLFTFHDQLVWARCCAGCFIYAVPPSSYNHRPLWGSFCYPCLQFLFGSSLRLNKLLRSPTQSDT